MARPLAQDLAPEDRSEVSDSPRDRYRYTEAVSNSQHDLHLLPRELPHQLCLSSGLDIKPMPSVCQERADYFGNRATHLVLAVAHTTLTVIAQSRSRSPRQMRFFPKKIRVGGGSGRNCSTALRPARTGDELPLAVHRAVGTICAATRVLHFRRDNAYSAGALRSCTVCATTSPTMRVPPPSPPLFTRCSANAGACARTLPTDDRLPAQFGSFRALCERLLGHLAATWPAPPGWRRMPHMPWLSVFSPRFGFVDLDPTNNSIVGDRHVALGHRPRFRRRDPATRSDPGRRPSRAVRGSRRRAIRGVGASQAHDPPLDYLRRRWHGRDGQSPAAL